MDYDSLKPKIGVPLVSATEAETMHPLSRGSFRIFERSRAGGWCSNRANNMSLSFFLEQRLRNVIVFVSFNIVGDGKRESSEQGFLFGFGVNP